MIEIRKINRILKVKLFAGALMICISISSYAFAQKQFIHTATKANHYCNNNCTLLDIPELNNNPFAIIWVTPILVNGVNLNPHPIGVYFVMKQWSIFNLDQTSIYEGAKFNVNYVANPDQNHFQYIIKDENLREGTIYHTDGSASIDHPALNNNPNAKFSFFQSWLPELEGGRSCNRHEVSLKFNNETGKWYIINNNKKSFNTKVTYNIILSSPADSITNTRSSASQKAVMINELATTPTSKSTSGDVTGVGAMYMTVWVNGTLIPGDNIRKDYLDKTEILGFEMAASETISSGKVAGKRAYEPITIKSRSGYPAAIPLFDAFVKNKDVAVTIEAITTSADGREELNYSIKFTNAHIAAFKQVYEEITPRTGAQLATKKSYDEIKIIFKKIEFIRGKISAEDNL